MEEILDRSVEVTDPPPRVVSPKEWRGQVKTANGLCLLVDRHLDYEANGRLTDSKNFRPEHLCPEQRVQLVSDMYAATR